MGFLLENVFSEGDTRRETAEELLADAFDAVGGDVYDDLPMTPIDCTLVRWARTKPMRVLSMFSVICTDLEGMLSAGMVVSTTGR